MKPRSARGFTLLEVLVAIFIMSLVLTFSFQAYQGIAEAYSRVSSTSSRDRAARTVLDRLERELVGAVLVEREDGADPLLHPYVFVAKPRMYAEAEGDELRFITQSPLRSPGGPPESVALVTYGSAPSKSGPGMDLLRQEEPLPAQLEKEVAWTAPQIVADNVAVFMARFTAEDGTALEEWDSTSVTQQDQLPVSLVLTVALWETDADGQPTPGQEVSRQIELPVRPFRLAPEDAGEQADEAECGPGMSVKACLGGFAAELAAASPALATAITDARAQVKDKCWNGADPSAALQRLKVLVGGIPGFDAGKCQ